MSAILNEEPKPISDLAPETPVALQRVVLRCLEKNAEQRFQSASDLAFALEALSDSAIATPTGAHAIIQRWSEEDARARSLANWVGRSSAGACGRSAGRLFLDAARTRSQGFELRSTHA